MILRASSVPLLCRYHIPGERSNISYCRHSILRTQVLQQRELGKGHGGRKSNTPSVPDLVMCSVSVVYTF